MRYNNTPDPSDPRNDIININVKSVVKETEKSYLVEFENNIITWMPKKLCKVNDKLIFMPKWFLNKKNLELSKNYKNE